MQKYLRIETMQKNKIKSKFLTQWLFSGFPKKSKGKPLFF